MLLLPFHRHWLAFEEHTSALECLLRRQCCIWYPRVSLLRALPGAAGASLGWLVFSSLFSVYVQHFGSYSVFYGSLAGIAMAMLWLYVCMSILFYGGVLNCLLFERRSQQGK